MAKSLVPRPSEYTADNPSKTAYGNGPYERSKTYFFIEETLYRLVTSNRAMGMVYAIDVKNNENVVLSWVDMRKNSYWAYTPYGAARMLNRSRRSVIRLINNGYVPLAQSTRAGKRIYKNHFLSRGAILQVHESLSLQRRGPMRKDGIVRAPKMPTREELIIQMKNEMVLYAKTKDGDFARIWHAEEW